MEYTSISQGIFFRHPKKQKKKATQVSNEDFLNANCAAAFGPPFETVELRQTFYRNHLKTLSSINKKIKGDWYEQLTHNVSDYVKSSAGSISEYQGAVTPIGFVITGAPGKEHEEIMDLLHIQVSEHNLPIAHLKSRSCKNVKTAFQLIARDLMDPEKSLAPDDSDEECDMDIEFGSNAGTIGSRGKLVRSKYINANDLKVWYKGQENAKPIVVIVSDIDVFAASLVQELMLTMCCLKLPMIFLAGITSCCESFESFIPRKCPTTFVYKTFETLPAEDRLEEFMNKIIFNTTQLFRFSGPVVKYMMDVFTQQDFSILRLEQMIQLCLLEHYRLPESVLCGSYDYVMEKILPDNNEVKNAVIDEGPLLLSVAGGVTEKRTAIRMRIAKTEDKIQSTVLFSPQKKGVGKKVSSRGELRAKVKNFGSMSFGLLAFIKFIHSISSAHPDIPVELKSFGKFYDLCWSNKINQENAQEQDSRSLLDQLLAIMKLMAKSAMIACLQRGIREVEPYCAENQEMSELSGFSKFVEEMEGYVDKLSTLDADTKLQRTPTKKNKKKEYATHHEWLEDIKRKATGTSSLHEQLMDKITKSIRTNSKYYFTALSEHQLSKAFVFDDVSFLQSMVTPSSCKLIHAALLEPEKFLECKNCTDGFCGRSDISILYDLILEQQMRNVNLNLIYESFKSMAENPEPGTPKKRKKIDTAKENEKFLIRFRHAVSELQHMGLIRKSKTKTHVDEVIRLNFGF